MKHASAQPAITARLAALSDGVRLRMLRLVEAQELSVGEVAAVLQLPQSTVSRHLKTLAEAGWVLRRAEGTASLFRLVPDELTSDSRTLWAAVREQAGTAAELAEDGRRLKGVVAERKTDSQSFFGRHSNDWDHLRTELFGGRFTSVALLSLLRRDWAVADLGCGTGNAAEFLAPYVERVYAVDVSDAMLAAARRRLDGAANVEFVLAGVERTGLPAASIDAAVCVLVLHHLDDPGAALAESRRLMRATRGGGVALFVDMMAHDREDYRRLMGHKHLGFSREAMEGMLKAAGFAQTTYLELPDEAEAKGPGLFAMTARI